MINRREFLTLSALTAGSVIFGDLVAETLLATDPETKERGQRKHMGPSNRQVGTPAPVSEAHFGMIIDVGACLGCRRCEFACKKENNIPENLQMNWIRVFERKNWEGINQVHSYPPQNSRTDYFDYNKPNSWYLPAQCYHCDNPPCVKVCPVGATYKSEDGIVMINYDRCIGCRYCMVACPYNARRFNWGAPEFKDSRELNSKVPERPPGVVEKCTFCVHRTRRGKKPRCVEACPVQARHFGNLTDPSSEVSKVLKSFRYVQLLQQKNTDPHLYYISDGITWNRRKKEWTMEVKRYQ